QKRPADAQEVLSLLEALEPAAPGPASAPPPSSDEEQRLVGVLLAHAGDAASRDLVLEAVRATVARFSGRVETLSCGAFVVEIKAKGSARDQASHAARCALAL